MKIEIIEELKDLPWDLVSARNGRNIDISCLSPECKKEDLHAWEDAFLSLGKRIRFLSGFIDDLKAVSEPGDPVDQQMDAYLFLLDDIKKDEMFARSKSMPDEDGKIDYADAINAWAIAQAKALAWNQEVTEFFTGQDAPVGIWQPDEFYYGEHRKKKKTQDMDLLLPVVALGGVGLIAYLAFSK